MFRFFSLRHDSDPISINVWERDYYYIRNDPRVERCVVVDKPQKKRNWQLPNFSFLSLAVGS